MAIRGSSEREPPIQPLSPPPPWRVAHNTLRALEPAELAAAPPDPWWGWFTEDLVQLAHPAGLRLDVGWTPEGAPDGAFRVVLIKDSAWDSPLRTAELRGLDELLATLDAWTQEAQPASEAPASDEELLARVRGAEDVRDAVSAVLALRERAAVGALEALLSDPRERVRYAAVDALTALGSAASAAGDALFARFLLPEPDLATRRRLIDALGAVGHAPAAPVLARWLANPDPEQRIGAARALVRLVPVSGAVDAAVVDAAQEAYATERSHRVRPHLREALQQLARGAR